MDEWLLPKKITPKCAVNPECQKTLEDITSGKISGASNAAIAALDAIEKCALSLKSNTPDEFAKSMSTGCCSFFLEVQPANISLSHGIHYLLNQIGLGVDRGLSVEGLKKLLSDKAEEFTKSVKESVERLGVVGQEFVHDGDTILTHGCSTSVLSILGNAHNNGKRIKTIVTEARPEFHGRLFAIAAADIGIPVRLIVDSAVSIFMKEATKAFLGAAAVFPTGRVLAKVGTSTVALTASNARKPAYVVATTDKFSPERVFALISESHLYDGNPSMVFQGGYGIEVSNPLYDLTPPEQINAIITQDGAIHPKESIRIVKTVYGDKPSLHGY